MFRYYKISDIDDWIGAYIRGLLDWKRCSLRSVIMSSVEVELSVQYAGSEDLCILCRFLPSSLTIHGQPLIDSQVPRSHIIFSGLRLDSPRNPDSRCYSCSISKECLMGVVYPFLLRALCGQMTSWRPSCKAHEVEEHIPDI